MIRASSRESAARAAAAAAEKEAQRLRRQTEAKEKLKEDAKEADIKKWALTQIYEEDLETIAGHCLLTSAHVNEKSFLYIPAGWVAWEHALTNAHGIRMSFASKIEDNVGKNELKRWAGLADAEPIGVAKAIEACMGRAGKP